MIHLLKDQLCLSMSKNQRITRKLMIPGLMYYATVTLNERFENKTGAVPKETNNFDYIDTIVNMLMTSVHAVELTGGQVAKFSADYQIGDPNGIIFDSVTCRAKVNELSETIQEDDRASQHRRRRCKACDGKCACSEATGDITVRRHIIGDVLKCTYICIKCVTPLKSKQSIKQHSENSKYRSRVGREAVKTRASCQQRQRLEKPNPVPIVLSLQDKFAKFCEKAYHQLKKDRLLTSKFPNYKGFFEVLTNPVDYTFWLYFKGQVAPTIYFYFIDITDLQNPGEYYGIYLCNSLTGNNAEPTKSVRFRIFEKCDNRNVSIHKLIAIRSELIKDEMRKCNYHSCQCKNKFTVGERNDMVGHILEYNFLLVCEGCRSGFSSWPQFIEHFTNQCFIDRPVCSDMSKSAEN